MFAEQAAHNELVTFFSTCYSTPAKFLIISPGRVNLIGEHTDYNLLPVLPMPISRGIEMAVCPHPTDTVEISNSDLEFEPRQFKLSAEIPPAPAGDWSNYVRAACQAIVPLLKRNGKTPCGFKGVVRSNLPAAAGLSSSSALVIASCMALCVANSIDLDKREMADLMRLAEHYVGTAGGGMDQAVISLGEPDHALLIEFDPIFASPVAIPEGLSIFVINSDEKADKSGTTRLAYNRRALECQLGLELLKKWAQQQNLAALTDQALSWQSLRDVHRDLGAAGIPATAVALQAVGTDPLSISDLTTLLGGEVLENLMRQKNMPSPDSSFWKTTPLSIHNRLSHVFGETLRVYRFAQALEHGRIAEAAQLASASHASCRDLYHISTPRIEHLVTQATRSGALAARITGAGFGGCIVAFVLDEKKAMFVESMSAYLVGHGTKNLHDTLIECESHGGARLRTWF